MSAITMETSYVNSDGDMGQAHIISHANQHDYLLPGEKKVIVLSNTQLEDKSQDLAMQKAIEQGVKTEDEWKEYNSKLMPSRQKESYQEYIKSLSNNYTKNIQRQLDKGTLTHAKKDKNYQSLKAIERNGGLAVEGDLYYLGNVDDYEGKNKKELKKYREFQAETFKRFYYSDIFKILNKGCFRGEIHQDEKGATHLQTQNVNYHMNSRGRVEMATGACQKEALIELYGSEEELNKRLDLLQASHQQKDKDKKKGAYRIDAYYWGSQNLLGQMKPATAGKRRMRIPELYRIEQMHELKRIALETAKQYNIDYKVTQKYTTDGVHKTAAGYAAEQKSQKKADKIIEDANKKANKIIEDANKKAQEQMNKAMEEHNNALALRAKVEHDQEELETQKKNRDKVFNGKMLDILAPHMNRTKHDELLNDGSIIVTVGSSRDKIEQRYLTIDSYIGLRINNLKQVRSNKSESVEKRQSADEKLARAQHTIVEHIAREHKDEDIDWENRFGIDPVLAPVNKVKKQQTQHKKVQKDDELEL